LKKEDLLKSYFLKQVKNGEELNEFLHELQKRGVEQILEGELNAHVTYDKHAKSDSARMVILLRRQKPFTLQ